jgi:hypothetical protein
MKVKIERCFAGGNFYFRLVLPNGQRERINEENWTRKVSSEALDLLESVYGFQRNKIKFIHQ